MYGNKFIQKSSDLPYLFVCKHIRQPYLCALMQYLCSFVLATKTFNCKPWSKRECELEIGESSYF